MKIDFPFVTSYKVKVVFHIIVASRCNDSVFVKVAIVIIIFDKPRLFLSNKDVTTNF